MRNQRTIIIFKVLCWDNKMYQNYFYRYIEPFSKLGSRDTYFDFNDFMLLAIRYALDGYYLGPDEALDRLDDGLGSYFSEFDGDDEDNPEPIRNYLSDNEYYQLTILIGDMSQIMEFDLVNTFERYRLPYDENYDIDNAIVRAESVLFTLIDLCKETW